MLDLLAALAKFALYAAAFVAAGIAFARPTLGRTLGEAARIAPAILLASAGSALVVSLFSVAILSERLGGLLDPALLAIIAETPAGWAAAMQISGSILILAFARTPGIGALATSLGGGLLLASFGINGHSASVSTVHGAVAFLHVCAASWWLGSLLLIRRGCDTLSPTDLSLLVRRFSLLALALVGALVVAGMALILALVRFETEDWLTPYAQALALKVVLASAILGLAAWNKLVVSPRLSAADGSGIRKLNHTIGIELGLFAAVLLATAWLTTFTSPHA